MKAMIRFSQKNSYGRLPYAQFDMQLEQGDFCVRSFKVKLDRIKCFDGSEDQ